MDFIGREANEVERRIMRLAVGKETMMPVKNIYVRPGTMLDIRVVTDPNDMLNNTGWEHQNKPQKILMTIHDARKVEVCGADVDTYGGRQCGTTMPKTNATMCGAPKASPFDDSPL